MTKSAVPSFCFLMVLLCLLALPAFGLQMKGRVYDRETQKPVAYAVVINTFTEYQVETDSNGNFTIPVQQGHLIEFQKLGYKIARVRIAGASLPFYSIALTKGPIELDNVNIKGSNYRSDSVEDRETYKWAIDHYTLDGMDVLSHPFDALSKRNRQIWAFQKRFQYFEQQKFIDFVFNDHLIQTITGLDSTDTKAYKAAYRPSYEQIKAWSTYEFYQYIRNTGFAFKRRRPENRN
jgi:hypothetical protein